MPETVRVRVVVEENALPVAETTITYYEGQDYTVQVVTPDGVDIAVPLTAGREAGS